LREYYYRMRTKKNILLKLIFLMALVFIIPDGYCAVPTGPMKKIEKGLFGRSVGKTKTKKVKEPRKVIKAKNTGKK
jgi:site-specific DNA-adenine methylase